MKIKDQRDMNEMLFKQMINENVDEEIEYPKKPNFLGYTYCPMKYTFKENFEEALSEYLKQTEDKKVTYFVPSGCGSEDPYQNLWDSADINEFPEVILGAGFKDYFREEFRIKFMGKGYFKAPQIASIRPEFEEAGMIDPDGEYLIYSVFPLVILVDKKKLGDLPMPKHWGDLLNPMYEKNITIGASHGDIHEDLLFYIYQAYGEEGVKQLAVNVKYTCHASQMIKIAGTKNSKSTAIYVAPWMFAKSCPRTEVVEIVWPTEGAIVTPLYMLVKEEGLHKYKTLWEFVVGRDYGQKSENNGFPVMNGEVTSKLPKGAKFKWLGWDFIKQNALEALKLKLLDLFKAHWRDEEENPSKEGIV